VETLKNSSQFERVRREGRSWGSGLLVLNAARNGIDGVRCGFITGKKLGKAVRRNRVRRQVREAVRLRLPLMKPGWDLVWIVRPAATEASFLDISRAVDELLQRSRILDPNSNSLPGRQEAPRARNTENNEQTANTQSTGESRPADPGLPPETTTA
jgi:ribonuclease P protein component